MIVICLLQAAASSMELHSPGQVAFVDVNNSTTTEATQYQDLHLRPPEHTGQYQELIMNQETSVKIVFNKPEITYENTKIQGQRESETKIQSEQSQYEELNTRNGKNNEHPYLEVSL